MKLTKSSGLAITQMNTVVHNYNPVIVSDIKSINITLKANFSKLLYSARCGFTFHLTEVSIRMSRLVLSPGGAKLFCLPAPPGDHFFIVL